MEEKIKRQKYLTRLLAEEPLSSQDDVASAMKKAGFDVTQSSVSRDFKDLGVVKIAGRYTPSITLKPAKDSTLQRMVERIDTAGANIVVVKTASGAAAVIAEAIDEDSLPGVVGSVAGDNTIFIATKNRAAQVRVLEHIKRLR